MTIATRYTLEKHRAEAPHFSIDVTRYLRDPAGGSPDTIAAVSSVVVQEDTTGAGAWADRSSEFPVQAISFVPGKILFRIAAAAQAAHQDAGIYRVVTTFTTAAGQLRVSENPLTVFQ